MDRLLDSIGILSVVLIGWVLISLRRAHIRVEYSVSWLFAGVVLLLVSRWRWPLETAGAYLGLSDAPLVLLLVIGSGLFVMFYRFSIVISRLKDDNIALAQRLAILEFHLNALRESRPEI